METTLEDVQFLKGALAGYPSAECAKAVEELQVIEEVIQMTPRGEDRELEHGEMRFVFSNRGALLAAFDRDQNLCDADWVLWMTENYEHVLDVKIEGAQ